MSSISEQQLFVLCVSARNKFHSSPLVRHLVSCLVGSGVVFDTTHQSLLPVFVEERRHVRLASGQYLCIKRVASNQVLHEVLLQASCCVDASARQLMLQWRKRHIKPPWNRRV